MYAFVWAEEAVGGTLAEPRFTIFCGDGTVEVPMLGVIPMVVELADENPSFRNGLRKYNASLSFTSMGVEYDEDLANGRGVYTFRICGVVVHRMGSIFPDQGKRPVFSQIYIRDPEEQADIRVAIFKDLEKDILMRLQENLQATNPFCQFYRSIQERENDQNVSQLKIVLRADSKRQEEAQERQAAQHNERRERRRRQYDAPSSAKVAVLIPGEQEGPRDVVIQAKDLGPLIHIPETHIAYDPLQYVLIHPRGENGWSFNTYPKRPRQANPPGNIVQQDNLQENDQDHQGPMIGQEEEPMIDQEVDLGAQFGEGVGTQFLSPRQFYAYRLQIRPMNDQDQRCHIWMLGRLTHQYVVDMYAKVESQRLNYLKMNQTKIRADLYQGVADAIANDVPHDERATGASIGMRVVLPSSFTGGPRNIQQLFQDAMSIVLSRATPNVATCHTCHPQAQSPTSPAGKV